MFICQCSVSYGFYSQISLCFWDLCLAHSFMRLSTHANKEGGEGNGLSLVYFHWERDHTWYTTLDEFTRYFSTGVCSLLRSHLRAVCSRSALSKDWVRNWHVAGTQVCLLLICMPRCAEVRPSSLGKEHGEEQTASRAAVSVSHVLQMTDLCHAADADCP